MATPTNSIKLFILCVILTDVSHISQTTRYFFNSDHATSSRFENQFAINQRKLDYSCTGAEQLKCNWTFQGFQTNALHQLFYHTQYTRRNLAIPIDFRFCVKILIIQLSGDIALNPGPIKFPCGGCYRPVASNHRAVYCEACYLWWHIKCAAISASEYVKLSNDDEPWLCRNCNTFHFSDSYFEPNISLDSSIQSDCEDNDIPAIFDELINIKKESPNKFTCAYININSLRNKFDFLKEILIKNIVDILFIAETKLDGSFPDAQWQVNGYHLWRADRNDKGGGIAVYLRSDIAGDRKSNLEFTDIESIFIEV
ncbi:uncharacterized protein LOC132735993 [Ruditapes philippinarum]|uniref:uncharacterized protein LOC132735993 n=1 Tax=Ruditapes philippinarum TaxID=129788 RepID=UPI00295AA8FF|nr:uncharacterized protein LOC132735993 [Ruditapes philippinarum]